MTDPPLPVAVLRRLALRVARNTPAAGIGPHLRRQQGHSLEFREYRAYTPGEDIRAVDWRASARHGTRGEWIARSFEAEQRLMLAILIDNRPEMALPVEAPKLLFALWVARALTALALDDSSEVLLAPLFNGPVQAITSLRGTAGHLRARRFAEALLAATATAQPSATGTTPFADLGALARRLRPASAVIVISDMLFNDPDGQFTRFARTAQRQRRSLSIVQLDSIAHETTILREAQEFHLLRPGLAESDDLFIFDEAPFATARQQADEHLRTMRKAIARGGLDWPQRAVIAWPGPSQDAPLGSGNFLADMFTSRFPRLPLVAGLGFGGRA